MRNIVGGFSPTVVPFQKPVCLAATRRKNALNPVIQANRDTRDKVRRTLAAYGIKFHELGHIFLHLIHDRKARFIDYEPAKDNATNQEEEANDFANNALIPEKQWNELMQKTPHNDNSIKAFAANHHIHPAIVLGRLLYEQNFYAVKSTIDRTLY